ncbi:cytochrome c551 [Jeotgalibacillus sp. R-1-5s-1]|uniref:cytochrome c551 n=1 Tax=Jeotgalibacillus sp. R-1-5s-1 TaxID=2555897 RepID=UPI00106D287A|nr:cytochrome c [Jeotgalibacillus sp. R-1-5s-1]TFD95817.1 cytochrome c [Jeotgalibacillus sp. R-1-5s-1]
MKKWWLALAAGSVLVLGACGGGEETTDSGSGEQASSGELDPREVYVGNCSGCHGDNLEGGSGPNLEDVGSRYSYDEILDIIQNGKGRMPGNLIEGEEAEVVAQWLSEQQ